MKKDRLSWILAVISLLAIIISFLTLMEMKNQRELEITPILQLNPFSSKLISNKPSTNCDSMVFTNRYFISDEKSQMPILDLVNLGFGPAIDVGLKWDLDLTWIEAFMTQNNIPGSLLKINSIDDDYSFEYKSCDIEGKYSIPKGKQIKLGHLPSVNTNSVQIQLDIPREIILSKMALFKANWISNNVNAENSYYTIKSEHKLSIQFESIHGKKYEENYTVEIRLSPKIGGQKFDDDNGLIYYSTFNDFALNVDMSRD